MARIFVTRYSCRKSLVFELVVVWLFRAIIFFVFNASHVPKMANIWLCFMRLTPLYSGTNLILNVSFSPTPSRKCIRILLQLTNAGCIVDTTSFACVVNDRRSSF